MENIQWNPSGWQPGQVQIHRCSIISINPDDGDEVVLRKIFFFFAVSIGI